MTKPDKKARKRRIASDVDSPTLTKEMFVKMRPATEVLPGILEKSRIGRPPKADRKQLVSLRLDLDVVTAYRSIGKGWQTAINEALRKSMPKRGTRRTFFWRQKRESPSNFARVPDAPKPHGKGKSGIHTEKR